LGWYEGSLTQPVRLLIVPYYSTLGRRQHNEFAVGGRRGRVPPVTPLAVTTPAASAAMVSTALQGFGHGQWPAIDLLPVGGCNSGLRRRICRHLDGGKVHKASSVPSRAMNP